ncbi:uncharacterized protein si:dkey-246e1.3 [Esox lucius]|uniref:uncharacterized protein si:dkey-246e1.3 n=1 Tax=Esox lucius TaxID=8010 RepID=UPI000577E91D|nr:uncharacterized protein si:dkey-246e1.3 [Esox lucius]
MVSRPIEISERSLRLGISLWWMPMGNNTSGSGNNAGVNVTAFNMNRTTALSPVDQDDNSVLYEFKAFNITLMSLALCILIITGMYCSISCHNRRRLSKRAHVYESAVQCNTAVSPVDIKAVKRSTSIRNPLSYFRRQDTPKDNSGIYYIYSNPLPIGLEDEETGQNTASRGMERYEKLTFHDYAKDPNNGIILDPPNFYMLL